MVGPGALLAGRYQLGHVLGTGSFGAVYRAIDLQNQWREVAVKLLRADCPSELQIHRFRAEAQALELLCPHPHIVTLFQRGELSGRDFLVMEYVDGPSLKEWLGRCDPQRPPSLAEGLQFACEVGNALAAAHTLKTPGPIVHRDVKPANVMLKRSVDGSLSAKLMDFGIARLNGGAATQEGLSPGTPEYMAPEQARGDHKAIGPWTDVFALAVLLVEVLTLRPTLPDGRALRDVAVHEPVRLRAFLATLRPEQPAALAGILAQALHADVRQRYPDAGTFIEALATLRQGGEGRKRWPWAASMLGRIPIVLSTLVSGLLLIRLLKPTPSSQGLVASHANPPVLGRARPEGDIPVGMIRLPGGTFRMGSSRIDAEAGFQMCASQVANDCKLASFLREMPDREVSLSPFLLDRTEVTTGQLAAWISKEEDLSVEKSLVNGQRIHRWVRQRGVLLLDLYPTLERSSGLLFDGHSFAAPPGRENKPATQVTWDGAARYCAAQGKRLPTEAEWEFAARRSPSFLYPWGSVPPRCADVVFRGSLSQTCSRDSGPRDVGMSPQDESPDGIRDLGGSVSEWVQDAFFAPYRLCPASGCRDPVEQPEQEGSAPYRVIRGGNWEWSAAALRGLARSRLRADLAVQMVGFRCACSVER